MIQRCKNWNCKSDIGFHTVSAIFSQRKTFYDINLPRNESRPVKSLLLTGLFPPNRPAKCYICFAIWVLSLPPLPPAHSSGSSQESLRCSGLITAVMAKAIFSNWYSYFQTISFTGHILIKVPVLDSVTFMAKSSFEVCFAVVCGESKRNVLYEMFFYLMKGPLLCAEIPNLTPMCKW